MMRKLLIAFGVCVAVTVSSLSVAVSVLLLMVSVGTPAFSADFHKGMDAAKRGDFATALREWKPLAEKGDDRAQNYLGVMYEKGDGVPQDYKTAFKWYKLAAEQGFATAQTNLGVMYAVGKETLQDYTRAHMWWNIAASQGVASARINRDNIENKMSPAQLETAQKLAREWMAKHQK